MRSEDVSAGLRAATAGLALGADFKATEPVFFLEEADPFAGAASTLASALAGELLAVWVLVTALFSAAFVDDFAFTTVPAAAFEPALGDDEVAAATDCRAVTDRAPAVLLAGSIGLPGAAARFRVASEPDDFLAVEEVFLVVTAVEAFSLEAVLWAPAGTEKPHHRAMLRIASGPVRIEFLRTRADYQRNL